MQIKGLSMFSSTTKPATKGEYPSNCYEVGLTDIDIIQTKNNEEKDWLADYIADHSKDVDLKDENGNTIGTQAMFKIKNSRFEIPMFDMNANKLPKAVALSNGTPITLDLAKQHSDKYNTDYLVVKAIQVNEPIKEYNPFKK